MNEPRTEEMNGENMAENQELKQKAVEIQRKVMDGIDRAMSSTAENLDKTADKMHQTASFFRNKNADNLKDDLGSMAKKYPAYTLAGAVILGFFFGRMLSR